MAIRQYVKTALLPYCPTAALPAASGFQKVLAYLFPRKLENLANLLTVAEMHIGW
jgi:hypothetical protein